MPPALLVPHSPHGVVDVGRAGGQRGAGPAVPDVPRPVLLSSIGCKYPYFGVLMRGQLVTDIKYVTQYKGQYDCHHVNVTNEVDGLTYNT